jgi:hypothetical protein
MRPERQLPSGENKLERMATHTKGLVGDFRDWVDLRIKLTKLEILEEVDAKVNEALIGVLVAAVGLLACVFLLVTIALGLGAWLGHPAWGFLIVTLALFLFAGIVHAVKPTIVGGGQRKVNVDEDALTPRTPGR